MDEVDVRSTRVRLTNVRSVVGFGLTMVILGVTTLVAIPAMVRSGGPLAWSSIAVGQSVGALGAVVLTYGWLVSGPADVARADHAGRRVEYTESVLVRLTLYLPVLIVAGVVSVVITRNDPTLAVLGAATTATTGLSSSWYFVGTAEPYRLLLLETVPRAAGTVTGIVLMEAGSSPAAGLISQLGGLIVGVAIASVYALRVGGDIAGDTRRRSLGQVLVDHRHGVATSVWGALYNTLPIVLVGIVAAPSLVQYAVLDKIQKQASSGLAPLAQVLQGWVPRAAARHVCLRAKRAVVVAVACCCVIVPGLIILGRPIVTWLGSGRIHVSLASVTLLAVIIGLALLSSVIGKAGLVPLGLIAVVSSRTLWSSAVGLTLVLVLGWAVGLDGALAGLLCGFAVRAVLLYVALDRASRQSGLIPIAASTH